MSIRSKALTTFMRVVNFKKIIAKEFLNPPRKNAFFPKKVERKFNHQTHLIDGKMMVTLLPEDASDAKHIVFFHGGNYALEINAFHWKFICLLVEKAKCKITLIDYPLIPEHTYRDTFALVDKMYATITEVYPADDFMLMGDSAGGGLAFAFAQKLRNESHPFQPSKNILFSPLLDLTMTNPEAPTFEKLDVILSIDAVAGGGKIYAGGDDISNYLLSPINGNLENLGETFVFFGTEDLFYPDCKKLESLAEETSSTVFHFFEYPGMPHDFMMLPIPEMGTMVNTVAELLSEPT